MESAKITAVEFKRADWEPTEVIATFTNGETKKIFSYYDDEISISEDELIGKTEDEACNVKIKKDVYYLQH